MPAPGAAGGGGGGRAARCLHAIRRAVGSDEVFQGGSTLQFNPELITSDVGEFEDAVERGAHEAAVGLIQALVGQGDRAGALQFANVHAALVRQHLETEPDAVSGPFVLGSLARVYLMAGQADRAVAILERLSRLPTWVSPAELRADPIWEPLRGHPRFQRLANGAEAPVT